MVNGSLTRSTPTQAASEHTNQLHQPQLNVNGVSRTTQSTPAQDAIGSATESPAHPSLVTNSSTVESQGKSNVDAAVRFSQCKEKGNALVKQVSIENQSDDIAKTKFVKLWEVIRYLERV